MSGSYRWCVALNPISPHDALKHHFTSLETDLTFLTTKGFRSNISMKLAYQYIVIFTFSLTSNQLHPLHVENCDSNSRLVVDEDDNGKFKLERVNNLQTAFNPLYLLNSSEPVNSCHGYLKSHQNIKMIRKFFKDRVREKWSRKDKLPHNRCCNGVQ